MARPHADPVAPAPPPGPTPAGWTSAALRARFGIGRDTHREGILRMVRREPELLQERVRQAFIAYFERPLEIRVELGPQTTVQGFSGTFPHIRLRVRDAVYEGILVSRVVIHLSEVMVDLSQLLFDDRLRFRRLGRYQFYVEIGERELNRYLFASGRSLSVETPRVELRDSGIRLSGRVRSPLGWTHIRVDGRFEVADETRINFVASGLKVAGLPLPGLIAREVFNRINPVADLARLNLRVKPDRIVTRTRRLSVLTHGMEQFLNEAGGHP